MHGADITGAGRSVLGGDVYGKFPEHALGGRG